MNMNNYHISNVFKTDTESRETPEGARFYPAELRVYIDSSFRIQRVAFDMPYSWPPSSEAVKWTRQAVRHDMHQLIFGELQQPIRDLLLIAKTQAAGAHVDRIMQIEKELDVIFSLPGDWWK